MNYGVYNTQQKDSRVEPPQKQERETVSVSYVSPHTQCLAQQCYLYQHILSETKCLLDVKPCVKPYTENFEEDTKP